MKELFEIQQQLNVPKEKFNSFGKYKYRSAEDILKAVKPLLEQQQCILLLTDEVKEVGSPYQQEITNKGASSTYNGTRVYVEASVTIINSAGDKITTKGYAREEISKSGMDASQITGTASSYARKYALNGLFAIDDGVDADRLNVSKQYTAAPVSNATSAVNGGDAIDANEILHAYAYPAIEQAQTKADLKRVYDDYPNLKGIPEFMHALSAKRKELGL